MQPFEHRNDTSQLLLVRNAGRPGSRRLAADIHDRRAFVERAPARRNRGRRLEMHAGVREGIRRHVDHAHHGRARKAFLDRRPLV